MKLIIELDEKRFKDIQRIASIQIIRQRSLTCEQIIANGTPLEDFIKNRKEPIDKDILKAYLKENKQYPFIDLPNMECDNNGNYIYFRENKQ